MQKVSISHEDYIESLYILEKKNEKNRAVKISQMLGVSRPAVTRAMNDLSASGLVNKETYGEISLSDKGRRLAKSVYDKHLIIKEFLLTLGVSDEVAEVDCCKIEHNVSTETLDCIKKFLTQNK